MTESNPATNTFYETLEKRAEEYSQDNLYLKQGFEYGYELGFEDGKRNRNCVDCSNHGKQIEVIKLKHEIEQLKMQNQIKDNTNESKK